MGTHHQDLLTAILEYRGGQARRAYDTLVNKGVPTFLLDQVLLNHPIHGRRSPPPFLRSRQVPQALRCIRGAANYIRRINSSWLDPVVVLPAFPTRLLQYFPQFHYRLPELLESYADRVVERRSTEKRKVERIRLMQPEVAFGVYIACVTFDITGRYYYAAKAATLAEAALNSRRKMAGVGGRYVVTEEAVKKALQRIRGRTDLKRPSSVQPTARKRR